MDFFVAKTAGAHALLLEQNQVVNHKMRENIGLITSGAGNL